MIDLHKYIYLKELYCVWVRCGLMILGTLGLCSFGYTQTRFDLAGESGYFCQGNKDQSRAHGAYGLIEVQYPFHSSWETHLGYSATLLSQNRSAHRLHLGIRYRLDVFTYVPWIGLNGYFTPASTWPIPLNLSEDTGEEQTDNTEEVTLTPLDDMMTSSPSGTVEGWGNKMGFFFEIGLDRYLNRDWRFGTVLRFQALPFLDSVPLATTVGFHLTYQWTLFDPFDE